VAVTRFLHGAPLTAAVVDACAAAVEGAAVILATQLVAVPRYHELLRAVVMARGDPDSPLVRMRPSAVASRVFSIRALQCTAVYVTAVRLLAAMARAAGLVAWIGPQILAAGGFAAISWTVARAALFTEHPDLADDSDASWVEGGQHDASGAEDLASGAAWLVPAGSGSGAPVSAAMPTSAAARRGPAALARPGMSADAMVRLALSTPGSGARVAPMPQLEPADDGAAPPPDRPVPALRATMLAPGAWAADGARCGWSFARGRPVRRGKHRHLLAPPEPAGPTTVVVSDRLLAAAARQGRSRPPSRAGDRKPPSRRSLSTGRRRATMAAAADDSLAVILAVQFPGTDTPAVGTFALTDVLRPAAAKVVRSRSTPPQLRVASVLH